ncbi:hypothetical protein [Haloferula sp. BvORR071]|uniref:RCC1-like domain-containing protein n=1 Tax=Haloferula sp. BvORR071 TaxID=1396141 RepID=UPI0006965BAF|nr:hypothetical protein [Haloferula sp. BvORR071]
MSPRFLVLLAAILPVAFSSALAQTIPPPFVLIARGATADHSAAIGNDGTLWTWGSDGTGTTHYSPFQIGTDTHWQRVAVGGDHTLAVRSDGTLWAWGSNYYGQIGDGGDTGLSSRSSPVQIGSGSTWQAVAAGKSHSIAIKSDGSLWAWGYNFYGQLGVGSQTQANTPVPVGTDHDWVAIAAGDSHTLALKSDGSAWAWGRNEDYQVGDDSSANRWSPVKVWGSATNWTSIAAGGYHSAGIRSDGSLWTWGRNDKGQLGGGTTNSPVPRHIGSDTDWLTVAAGGDHCVALKTGGSLWAWGSNAYGQLGDGTYITRGSPVAIGTATNWQAIAAGTAHSHGMRSDGSLWSWGYNFSGQLAAGSQPVSLDAELGHQTVIAAAAGFTHSLAVKSDGTLWTWGSNSDGQLGDGTLTNRSSAVQVGSSSDWVSVTASSNRSLALKSNGTLWAWGDNSNRALGDGNQTDRISPVQIGSATTWRAIAAGPTHSVALRSDGTLWVWGNNVHGQLGDGTQTTRPSPIQLSGNNWTAVAAGQWHTLALKSDGTLWAWGLNDSGQLGDGTGFTTMRQLSPVQVGTATDWSAIGAGDLHSIALKTNGTLWTWGHNGAGQLGTTGAAYRYSPFQVGSASNWQSIAAGLSHCVALKRDGTLWGWGSDLHGQLTLNNRNYFNLPQQLSSAPGWTLVPGGTGWTHTLALRGGRLWGFGSNASGQLPGGDMGRAVPRRSMPARGAQSVSLPGPSAAIGVPVTLAATASSGLPVSYSLNGPATLNGNTLTRAGAGEIRLDAWQSGNDSDWLPSAIATVVDDPPLTPLQQWKLSEIGDANAADGDDADGDGLVNLAEYGLVLPPASPSVAPAVTRAGYADGERLRIFVQRDPARNDVTIDVLGADGPEGPWTSLATSAQGAPFSGPGYVTGDDAGPGVKTVEVRDTVRVSEARRRFMRVVVVRAGL